MTVGRIKEWPENIRLPLPKGSKERIAAVLKPDETRTDFLRAAVEREIERRRKAKPKT